MDEPADARERPGVLVVDDRPENVAHLIKILEPEGYRLAHANSGEEAMALVRSFRPHLILMDVMMPPGMDGFSTCRMLKEDTETRDIPVVFVTAKNETDAIVEGFKCGGQDYIPKPFRREEVLSRVRTHIRIQILISDQARLIAELQDALAQVKTLRGLLPICASCKKIRDDKGYWHQIETYLSCHADVDFTHGICTECMKTLYPDLYGDSSS
ncbi:MAG: response regulator [Desulfobacterales bacterium]|nr:response regulator [Desulfobacterales bacterium]